MYTVSCFVTLDDTGKQRIRQAGWETMPRVNRAIELLEQGQPLYYTGAGESRTYENGVEHGADVGRLPEGLGDGRIMRSTYRGLSAFMRGWSPAGPTRSGHRTPTVIATLPTDGTSEAEVMAGSIAWMVKHCS